MKRILCLMLVLVLAMSLCACGGDKKKDTALSKPVNKPQDGMYLFHGYDLDGEITTDSLGAVSNPLNPDQVYAGLTYTPEMFYGDYCLGGNWPLSDQAQAEHIAACQTMTFEINGNTWNTPVVPYRIEMGHETFPHVVQYDTQYHWARMHFAVVDGYAKEIVCRFDVSGNKLRFFPLTKWNYDDNSKHLTYQMTDIVWEYDFSFKGPHLTLSQGSTSIQLTADVFADKDMFCYSGSYLTPGSPTFDNMDFVRLNGTKVSVESNSYDLRYHSPVAGLTEDGLLTLSWKDHDDNTYVHQFVYFLCGLDGLFLADNEHTYQFQSDYFQRMGDSLNGSVLVEELDALENMSEEEIEQIIEKREDLLTDLATAYEASGLAVTVNQETGEIVMDSSVLFDVNSAEISQQGKDFLKQFIGVYNSVVFDEKYAGFVSKIMVEGHTDTSGDFDHNLELSQKRADSVRSYCLSDECGVETENRSVLETMLVAAGYSYTNPVYDANGEVDMAASRRVAFRFLINLGA